MVRETSPAGMPLTTLFPLLVLTWSVGAQAATTLTLTVPHGLQGTIVQGALNITTDTQVAGINAEILLPAGVTVNAVQKGTLLNPAGSFELDFEVSGSSLKVIAWSATHTFTGNGEVLKLFLQLGGATPGVKQLNFAATNPVPQINSRHAASNADGSQSLAHSTVNTSFLVYSANSDHDGDGMPDAWEDEHDLDPLTASANADADGDGYTDLEEYQAGTNPRNPSSRPGVVFADGFESPPP